MMYRIVHCTNYRYNAPVSRCRNEAHLRPRDTATQHCVANDLVVEPTPTSWTERTDFYGNPVASFAVDGPFQVLTVTSTSSVSVSESDREPLPPARQQWEEVRDLLASDLSPPFLAAREFCFESPLVPHSSNVRTYAEPSFVPGRLLVDAVAELTERIFIDFLYDPGFTTVTTPLEDVLRFRRGVCQDFAHLAIGCLRSMGLAARYVSGYLETAPPTGGRRMVGADASHAWPSVFIPGWGWLDVDPTNDQIVGPTYVTTAWGRDYADVTPLKGIVFGGGDSHLLNVSVDVTRSLVDPELSPPGNGLKSVR
jgi:transglutaminase-like putative cysteine protease